jgi:ABC-type Na+ transport system ATPase subunit NatA
MDEICDNIAVLHNAKIRYIGSPQDLKKKHAKDNLDQAFLSEINS